MRSFFISILLILSFGYAQYADFGNVYEGDRGVTVTVLPSEDGESALVRLERTGTPLDGLVLSAAYDAESEQVTLPYKGRDWALVYSDGFGGLTLRVPGQAEETFVYYDEEASESLNVAEFVRDAERDRADADAVTAFSRDAEEAQVMTNLESPLSSVAEACGYEPNVSIDWETISDEALANTSIYSFAAIPLDAMARVCQEDAVLAEQLSSDVATVVFELDETLTLTLEDDALMFRSNPGAANQGDFAYNVLLNTLRTAP